MVSLVYILLVAIPVFWIYSTVTSLKKNIEAAKRSGLPYVVTPVSLYNPFWLITHQLWLRIIMRLPKSWTESWVDYMTPDWCWELLYEPFRKIGDTFLTVAPGGIICWVSNAEAIHQIAIRREAFPKPLQSYKILEVFGKNVITTEGHEWRAHRKVLSPAVNEKNNAMVFAESCAQAQGMLRKWSAQGSKTMTDVPTDTMRLALHIITRIGFGVRLLWPGEKNVTKEQTQQDAAYSSHEPPKGHSMSFENSITTLLENLIWVLLTPSWILKKLPAKGAQKGFQSFISWRQYMNELLKQRLEELRAGKQSEGMDIMGSLVKSAYGNSEKGEAGQPTLSDSDILGNAFVMIVAGHETSSNSIHFSLLELAISPKSQILAQEEITELFGNTDPSTWNYESSVNALLGGYVGAVLNEQLRLMPPVINIPKSVPANCDQVINIDGKKITIPAGTHINLNTIGVHRNPRYWATSPSKITSASNDLDDFRPERWLPSTETTTKKQCDSNSSQDSSEDEFGGQTGRTTAPTLHHPPRGAYLPFSIGPRSCLGRRLAQVKIMAVLAVLFQTHSVELAVDEWATDEEVARMNDQQKREVYGKAQAKAKMTMRGATSLITLKLHNGPGYVPVRVCKRGEERFLHIMDC